MATPLGKLCQSSGASRRRMLGSTVESLMIEFDQEKLNSPKASGVSRGDNVVSPNVSSETRAMTHGQDGNGD